MDRSAPVSLPRGCALRQQGALPVITELEFKSLASEGYNRIPLMAEAFADLETPLSLYLKLAHTKDGGKHSFLLESVVGGERFGRYSFIGLPARTLLRASGFGDAAHTEVLTDGVVVESATGNPLDFIAAYQQQSPDQEKLHDEVVFQAGVYRMGHWAQKWVHFFGPVNGKTKVDSFIGYAAHLGLIRGGTPSGLYC